MYCSQLYKVFFLSNKGKTLLEITLLNFVSASLVFSLDLSAVSESLGWTLLRCWRKLRQWKAHLENFILVSFTAPHSPYRLLILLLKYIYSFGTQNCYNRECARYPFSNISPSECLYLTLSTQSYRIIFPQRFPIVQNVFSPGHGVRIFWHLFDLVGGVFSVDKPSLHPCALNAFSFIVLFAQIRPLCSVNGWNRLSLDRIFFCNRKL